MPICPPCLMSLALDASPGAAELCQLLVRRWAEGDAPAAATWTSRLPESPVRRAALEQVAIAWANTDLPAATGWVQALPEGDSKQAATLDLAYEAARTEPVTALVTGEHISARRVSAMICWFTPSANGRGTNSTTAAAWATKVLDPSLRQRLVAAVAVASAEQDGAVCRHARRKHPRRRGRTGPHGGFHRATLGAEFATTLRLPGSHNSRITHRAMRRYKTFWPFGSPRTPRRRATGCVNCRPVPCVTPGLMPMLKRWQTATEPRQWWRLPEGCNLVLRSAPQPRGGMAKPAAIEDSAVAIIGWQIVLRHA